ncbi:hypothetical protein ACGFXC_20635 [Streptomyces sp. NPDC048507]|uniref:hypothetical protein n=1 Tax=Streptomyces sp. NPDC048507 TaxID=3365560 RepID=UPI00371E175A
MPTQNTLQSAGPARPSAAEANEAIRLLVETRVDGEWPAQAYEFLLEEWAAASRKDVRADW